MELAENLEAIKTHHLQSSPVVMNLADLINTYEITDLTFLNRLVESLLASNSGLQQDFNFQITPESLLRTELLSEDLAPWAKSLRMKLFGKPEAPCDSYDSAVNWMKKI